MNRLLPLGWVALLMILACGSDPAGDAGPDASSGDERSDAAATDAAAGRDATSPVDGGDLDGGAPGDAGEPDAGTVPGVVVENEGLVAVYHDVDGTVLAVLPTPSEHPLPSGGAVTVVTHRLITLTEVPALARIRVPEPSDLPPDPRQALAIDVPEPPLTPNVFVSNGCVATFATGPQVLEVDGACTAEDGTTELWIFGYDGGQGHYLHVPEIAVGPAGSAPLEVALGPWIPFPPQAPAVTLLGLPKELEATVTAYALRGPLPVFNVTASFPSGPEVEAVLNATLPELGREWRSELTLFRRDHAQFERWTRAGLHQSLGHPLPARSTMRAEQLLPLPRDLTFDREEQRLRWSFEGPVPKAAQRVRVTLGEEGASAPGSCGHPGAPPSCASRSCPRRSAIGCRR